MKYQIKFYRVLTFFMCMFLSCYNVKFLHSQDLHYAQFYNSSLNINPAYAGIFNGDQRIQASFRDQWRSVPVPWTSFSMSYDQKFLPKISETHFFSGGINFNYDRQGLSKLTLSNLNIVGSYSRVLNKSNILTAGLSLGYATRGFNPTSLTWDQQWTGDIFDPGLPSGEVFYAERVNFVENAIGINYRWQRDSRTKIDLGFGAFHFIEPKVAFFDNSDTHLPRRLNLSAVASFQVLDPVDIQVHGVSQFQDDYQQYLIGGLARIYVDRRRGKEFTLDMGVQYRTTKSIIPTIAFQFDAIYVSFSYDIDMSGFQEYTNKKGGPELHFNYIIKKVKPFRNFKVCPIF